MNNSRPDSTNIDRALVSNEDFLVSDQDRIYFRAVVQYGFQVVIQVFGIITNTINIFIFAKIGLNDSVTITFFGLAISDLLHLISYLVFRLVLLSDFYFKIKSGIVPGGFGYPFSLYSIYFYDASMYITVFATLQKCCCVTFPLQFKNAFTKRRTYITILAIFIITLAIFLPVLTGLPFVYVFNRLTNKTLLTVKILKHYRPAEYYWQTIVKTGLTPISQLIVIICLIVMTKKLRASAYFRVSSKAKQNEPETGDEGRKDTKLGKNDIQGRKETKLGKNDIRALQAVQLVCFVFVVTSLPPGIAYLVQSVYPPFNTSYMVNLKHAIFNTMYFFGTINASVNIFFYLRFNTNYKNAFWKFFVCQQIKKSK